jgi:hypothetical protein
VSLDAGSLVVGRGTLEQDPSSPTSLPNVTPLPWARRLRGPSYTGLLTGKRLEREGNSAATRVLAVDGDSGQAVTVESSAGFSAGDRFTILDVQAGDLATIEAVKSGAPIRRQAAASRR